MLKKIALKKILISTITLFAVFLLIIIPKDSKEYNQILEYIPQETKTSPIYLLDNNNYLGITSISVNNENVVDLSRELIETIIKDGVNESKIPNGFRSFISSETKINNISVNNNIPKIDFSKELFDTVNYEEESIIESIVYTLTSIDDIKKVIITVDGEKIGSLPQTGIIVPEILDRTFGINKEYSINSLKDINKVTIYYISKYNDNTYYVPVTKYVNDNRDKISIIIDELSSSPMYSTNLMSYLNSNTKLLNQTINDNTLTLLFNNYIFDNADSKTILEEVIYTLNNSIKDSCNINEVIYMVNDEEIYKSTLKLLE